MVTADAEESGRPEADPLSEREREVLRLLALGHTNQEIAEKLYISVRTAESHRAHIMQKLRLATRAELVATRSRKACWLKTPRETPAASTSRRNDLTRTVRSEDVVLADRLHRCRPTCSPRRPSS